MKKIYIFVIGLFLLVSAYKINADFFVSGHNAADDTQLTGQEAENIVEDSSMVANYGLVMQSASNPSNTDFLHRDTDDGNLKYYDEVAAAWKTVIGASDNDTSFTTAFEKYISGAYIYRVDDDTVGIRPGVVMINGKLRRNTSAVTADPDPLTATRVVDVYAVADADNTQFTIECVTSTSGFQPGTTTPSGTNARLIGAIYLDADGDLTSAYSWQMRNGYIVFAVYEEGDDTTEIESDLSSSIPTFTDVPYTEVSFIGSYTGIPTNLGDYDANPAAEQAVGTAYKDNTVNGGTIKWVSGSAGTFASGEYYGSLVIHYGNYDDDGS